MGNVCSVSISTEDIAGRCCDCTAARANYICKLQENRVTLRTELQKLRELRNDVKRKVDVAERQQMKRLDQVQGWLSRVEAMETEVTQLIGDGAENIEEKRFCGSCYPKHCISSYTLGKKVVRKLQQVAALTSDGRFEVVADIVPPAAVEEIPSGTTVGLESTFDRVWRCFGEEHVGMIGLYGLGGVGKTTLLTQINNHFLKTSHNFDVVIWVVVSKTPNLDEVQNEIWEKVGFCDDKWKSKSRHLKAKDIWKALNEKRFVMLLDDLWEQMNLLEVGIPPPHQQNKSKLIFTTRSLDLCGQMGAQKKIEVKSLAWKDSWDLFQKYVGEDTLNSDPEIPEQAEIVARECCGLPLVIITIGRAMASKVTPQDWKHAIRVLQTSASKFPGMGDPVYPRLKYSYDSLPTKIVQSCFLYCSLFPEDFSIDKEALIWKWICEGFLDEYDDMDGAKNQGFNIINTLIHACLLEEPLDTNSVKLHDVIRDMALWITGEMGEMKGKFLVQTGAGLTQAPEFVKWTTAERISLMQNRIKKLIGSPTCPNLSTLLLDSNRPLNVISNGFFQFMPNLRVLSLNGTNIIELPSDMSNSVSLQYLDLSWTRISWFPVGMKNLVKLKRLELACTDELSSIPRGLISSLSMLQTINLYRCGFEPDGNESLVEELESLKYLIDLRITIVSACVFERFLSSRKLRSCTHGICLRIFKGSISLNVSSLENIKHLNSFWMEYCDTLIKFDWAEKGKETVDYSNLNPKVKCFNGLETVTILGCRMLKNLTWLIFAPNLKYLEIALCQQMEEVIGRGDEDGGNRSPFTNLIEVRLLQLPQLKSMYWNPLPFLYLERIKVAGCPKLKKLPLNSNSARERRVMIEGEEKWWNELEWEDEATLNPEFGLLSRLAVLQLGNNSLSGQIPRELANCSSLVWLDLNSNRLTGEIPPRLGRQLGAKSLSGILSGNTLAFVRNLGNSCKGVGGLLEFAGIRPERLLQIPTLKTCDFTRMYSGAVLSLFTKYQTLEYLDLSYNELRGKIPDEIGGMVALQVLELSHNQLSGEIPSSLGQLRNLGVFDASHNRLQGHIPDSFSNLSFLVQIDLSYNELTGQIPTRGQLSTLPASQYANNPGLCGVPLPECQNDDNQPVTVIDNTAGKGGKRPATASWANSIVLGVLISIASICILIVWAIAMRARRKEAEEVKMLNSLQACHAATTWKIDKEKEPLSINVATFQRQLRKLRFSQLIEATNGFSAASLIGCGGFGEVFKATLKDGSSVAIKKLIRLSCQGDREFMAEMETLGKIKHRNLVPLLGYCKVGEERLLVYEFMEYGSLEEMLHGKAKARDRRILTWEERKKIARGAAKGLCFLHHNCIPHIIHRDMKSSNVLLDHEMEARVSDFGMARLISALDTHLSVSTLAGTPGYVPPEYYQSFRCTAKGDVYSFGVVLLELLTGKRPTDKEDFGDTNLVGWVKMKVKEGKGMEVIDPELLSVTKGTDEAEAEEVNEMVRYLDITMQCVEDFPSKRPNMLQAVAMLRELIPGSSNASNSG